MKWDVLVIGSLNIDIVAKVKERPKIGETVKSQQLIYNYGGKGANQAYAAAKFGAKVAMYGNVGKDGFGEEMKKNLEIQGVDVSYINSSSFQPTGTAMIIIDKEGDNSIVIGSGANDETKPAGIRKAENIFQEAAYLLIQLEIPMESIIEAVNSASNCKQKIILDPAPAEDLPDDLLAKIDIITPNQSEIFTLTGVEVSDFNSAVKASKILLKRGVGAVCAKLGAEGVVVVTKEEAELISGQAVETVDTTAAGDVFAGALTAKMATGSTLKEAAAYANYAAAHACTKIGAQASIPEKKELEDWIIKQKNEVLE